MGSVTSTLRVRNLKLMIRPADDKLARMIPDKLTRREVLTGIAMASLFPVGSLKAESGASQLCFTSAVEMARLIRAKKLSA
ncbi:MAG TPA: hypothetical protein VKB58_15120, partial [Terriglobales bacterium]|nr:hypothetical protein [Terriglobales bacterium]